MKQKQNVSQIKKKKRYFIFHLLNESEENTQTSEINNKVEFSEYFSRNKKEVMNNKGKIILKIENVQNIKHVRKIFQSENPMHYNI